MEKEIRIKVHSFCDLITNSSTTIFVSTHGESIKLLKEFVDYLLKNAGSPFKAKDLFDFKIEINDDYLVGLYDELEDSEIPTDLRNKIELLSNSKEKGFYKNIEKLKIDYIREKVNNNEIEVRDNDESNQREDDLVIIPKNNTEDVKNVTKAVRAMFEIEESYE
jgi:hypothetical protein